MEIRFFFWGWGGRDSLNSMTKLFFSHMKLWDGESIRWYNVFPPVRDTIPIWYMVLAAYDIFVPLRIQSLLRDNAWAAEKKSKEKIQVVRDILLIQPFSHGLLSMLHQIFTGIRTFIWLYFFTDFIFLWTRHPGTPGMSNKPCPSIWRVLNYFFFCLWLCLIVSVKVCA